MRRFLLLALVLALASGAASAQERIRGGVLPKKDKDKVRMVPRGGDPKKKDEGSKPEKKPAEAPKEEPKPTDPVEAALEKLATWPSGEARQAATALAFRGPEAEPRLIEALRSAAPALAAGICYVLGEIGGDAALPAVQGQAARTEMVEHLSVLFDAIGKLDGIGAVKRVLPFLRHPRSPARAAAEAWLGERMNASHLPRLTAFLTDASAGARHSALRLLRGLAAAEVARSWAFRLLDDPSPTVARTAADVLATDAGEETIPRLVEAAGEDATRRAAYSMLALVLIEDKSGVRPYSTDTVKALLGAVGLRSPQKLNRGVAAIALADVGYDSEVPEVDAVLDNEVTLTLLNTIGGRTYFKDYATLAEMARERFGRLTGIRERRSIPELWEWWHAQEGVFVARRSLRKIDPARIGVFRVRARSVTEPALPSTLFSNVAADAGSPEVVGLGYVYLLPAEAAALAGTVSEELLGLPDSGVALGSGILGPEVEVTVSMENRARTVTGRRGAVPPGLVKVVELLKEIRAAHSWQTYWDRDRYPRYEEFIRAEAAFFGANPPEASRVVRVKDLILGALDDLATEAQRVAAVEALSELDVRLEDSDAYRLALFLDREKGLTPLSERVVRVLAKTGRPLVVPVLTDWLERNPGPRALTYLVDALVRLGAGDVAKAGKSDRIVLRRAAMTAGPAVLPRERLERFLAAGVGDASHLVRRAALSALGRTKAKWALPIIESALDDPESQVSDVAVEALGQLGLPEALPPLVRELRADPTERRIAAVKALCRSGLSEALTPVLLALSQDSEPAVRAVAAREIGRFGVQALKGLSRIVTSAEEDVAVRVQAVGALARIGRDAVTDVLEALVEDPQEDVADAAAWALASRARKSAVPQLLSALSKGRNPIRTVAALEQVSMQSFPSARADELPAIYRGWWAEKQDHGEAAWFVEALTAKGYETPPLRLLAQGRLDPNAVPSLIEALGDEAWYVRSNANLWLQRIALEDFGEVTRFSSEDEVRKVMTSWKTWWEAR